MIRSDHGVPEFAIRPAKLWTVGKEGHVDTRPGALRNCKTLNVGANPIAALKMEIPVNVNAKRSPFVTYSRDKRATSEFGQRVWLEGLIAAVASACLCMVILACVLRLWDADLTVPLLKNGDAIMNAMPVKSMVDNGWWLRNPHLGMPFGQQLLDTPFVDNLSMALMKLLSLFTRNYAVLMNLFFFLTFPITTITSLFVLRSFAISYPSAIVVSLLYAFLPYHFFRGEAHLFLSAYYLVPVVVMICVWLWRDELDVLSLDAANRSRISRRLAFVLLALLFVG